LELGGNCIEKDISCQPPVLYLWAAVNSSPSKDVPKSTGAKLVTLELVIVRVGVWVRVRVRVKIGAKARIRIRVTAADLGG